MIITIIILAGVLSLTFILAKDAPWFPTRKNDVIRFLKLVDIKQGQKMYDLGCGDGRLVCAAANAGANAQGIELSLLPFILASIRKVFSKNKSRIKFLYKNIWATNISDADVVYVWLMPAANPKLKQKFESELRKGAKVVSYVWPIEGWQPVKVDEIRNRCKLYLYQI